VIINEFGKISIDSQTLRSSSAAGTVFEISAGCICCSVKGYFHENLENIVKSGKYERIIMEPSGLGGIEMVSEIVAANPDLSLMPVLCLVDITAIENPRIQLLPIYRSQIQAADLILFTKCDLLAELNAKARLVEKFIRFFPEKQNCIVISDSNLLSGLLYGQNISLSEFSSSEEISPEPAAIFPFNKMYTDGNYYADHYISDVDEIFDSLRLISFFNDNPSLIRVKGHVLTENGWNLVNFTYSGCIFEPCLAKRQNEIVIIVEKSETSQFKSINDLIGNTVIRKSACT